MASLKFRHHLQDYKRDSYLTAAVALDPGYPLLDCAIGSSQFGMSDLAVAAHKKHEVTRAVAYPELFYDSLLKPAILKRFGLAPALAPQLFFGHGSFNLAERLIHKLIAPSMMLGVGPQFNEIPSEFVAAGGRYYPIPMQPPSYAFPVTEVIEAIIRYEPSVVYIDNPNNPLGSVLDLMTISIIAKVAAKRGAIVLVDEAYGDFVPDEASAFTLVEHTPNLAVIRSFSKGLGLAAARIGYMLVSPQIAEHYRELDVPFEPGLHSAELAFATLQDTAFIERVRTEAMETKTIIAVALDVNGFNILPTHRATSIMTIYREGENLAERFASIGIAVEPGAAFQQTNRNWTNEYCRIRIPPPSKVKEFVRRLESLSTGALHADKR